MMKIKFQGSHTKDEIVESLTAILQLFQEQYGIDKFNEVSMDMVLFNTEGEEVELMDVNSEEVFNVLEVHKNLDALDDSSVQLRLLEDMDQDSTMH